MADFLASVHAATSGIDVLPDPYLPTWIAVGEADEKTRVVYALKRNGIARRLYCSPENFKIVMSLGGPVPPDVLSWAVVDIPEMEFRL